MNFRSFLLIISGSALLSTLPACMATEQTSEQAVPSAVSTDADRRAIYNSNGQSSSVPDATPNRMRLGEQASDINSQKRVETIGTNDANNVTPETRLRRIEYSGDTLP